MTDKGKTHKSQSDVPRVNRPLSASPLRLPGHILRAHQAQLKQEFYHRRSREYAIPDDPHSSHS